MMGSSFLLMHRLYRTMSDRGQSYSTFFQEGAC
jgi:hypothetical protein